MHSISLSISIHVSFRRIYIFLLFYCSAWERGVNPSCHLENRPEIEKPSIVHALPFTPLWKLFSFGIFSYFHIFSLRTGGNEKKKFMTWHFVRKSSFHHYAQWYCIEKCIVIYFFPSFFQKTFLWDVLLNLKPANQLFCRFSLLPPFTETQLFVFFFVRTDIETETQKIDWRNTGTSIRFFFSFISFWNLSDWSFGAKKCHEFLKKFSSHVFRGQFFVS